MIEGETYREVSGMSSASAREVVTCALAVVPAVGWLTAGKFALKFLYSSSLGF